MSKKKDLPSAQDVYRGKTLQTVRQSDSYDMGARAVTKLDTMGRKFGGRVEPVRKLPNKPEV